MAFTALVGVGGRTSCVLATRSASRRASRSGRRLLRSTLYVFSLGAVMRGVVQIRHRIPVVRGPLLLYAASVVVGAALLLQGPYWFWPLLLLFVGNAIAAFVLTPRVLLTVEFIQRNCASVF